MNADRRTTPRALRRLRVLIGADVFFTADVTANGFCAETRRPAQPGTSLSGRITVGEMQFEFIGMVCWARGEEQHGRMGVRFLEVSPDFEAEFDTAH
jgi:hypothetical protein